MKKLYSIYLISFLALASHMVTAQQQNALAPQIGNLKGINYQAVAVDEEGKEIVGMDINGKPLHDKTIGVRFTILKGSEGPVLYQETHTATTDAYGLFSLVIGTGTVTEGQHAILMDIPWIDADQFLKVEIATKNDGNYKLVSNQQFMSVPYSFYTDDIADNAITTAKILDETILSTDIAPGAVTTSEILDNTILNQDIADTTIDLTAKVSGVLPVANGGTGNSALMDNSLVIGKGTGPVASLGVATDGQIPIGATGGSPVLANITAGTGIVVTNSPGGILISSGVQGVNSTSAGNVQVGSPSATCPEGRELAAGATWISPSIPLTGVALGNIMVGSINYDLQGCMMTTYVRTENQITVSIHNGTGAKACFAPNLALRVLIVQ
jgi:hypothetical protein